MKTMKLLTIILVLLGGAPWSEGKDRGDCSGEHQAE